MCRRFANELDSLGIFFAQSMRGLDFVLQFGGDFVEADLGGGSGGKAAVGVQGDAGRFKVLEGRLDAGNDLVGRIDLAGITADATEADLKVFAQVFEHGHVTSSRSGEFHGEMIHFQAVELAENGSVASGVGGFAASTGACTAAEVNCKLDIIEAFNDPVYHVDTEVSRVVGVVVFRADAGIDEQAKVRVVDLNDGDTFFAKEFNFSAKDGNAVGDE